MLWLIPPSVPASGIRELPTDANFAWAKDSYSKRQRTISIWSSLATLRTRLWLAETKQTYPGGFTAAKQSVSNYFGAAAADARAGVRARR